MRAVAKARVFLRSPVLRDEAEFLRLMRRSARLHRGWVSPPNTPQRFRASLAAARRAGTRTYLICLARDGAIAGYATLSQICGGPFRSAYLGFTGGSPYVGAGYMTEGIGRVLREAFITLGLHRVEANIQPENTKSLGLVQRAGFPEICSIAMFIYTTRESPRRTLAPS
jgi:ribosomal-protein-alanine N-acetyltransferase